MSVKVQVSEVIDRPMAEVFHFTAHDHVRNHPRLDPYMQLEQVSDGPIGVETVIKRVNSHGGTPVEGTMEIMEYELNRAVGMVVHDGPVEMTARATYEAESDNLTRLTWNVEVPGMDESMDTSMLISGMQESLRTIKQLIESEF